MHHSIYKKTVTLSQSQNRKNMEELIRLDHVCQYNELLGVETLHPLISVIDWSKCAPMLHHRQRFGFYTIF